MMQFSVGPEFADIKVDQLFIAGWTGRDAGAVQHHIDELAAIGIAPPSATPLYYRVSNTLLTQDASIQVVGDGSSGEAEPLLLRQNGSLWLGLASDHTDRDLEVTSVAASKQACLKPCATALWEFSTVEAHLDQLLLKSWIKEDGNWTAYQDGTLAQILPLTSLAKQIEHINYAGMLCGTLPAIGGVRAAAEFRAELSDPFLNRAISFEYRSACLPIVA